MSLHSSSRQMTLRFICMDFCIIDTFLRLQNSRVHNFRKNTEQFLA